ncbi:peptidoglycan DD-metalloendopeptidase family protein [Aminicella lysinilytica]|uniref:peptidoglycan DD-metalloendopeptidase family protein n=1 Tax=Aminicella lysinilytica TaxID=433323 RepID=UPI0026EAA860|nr:peptidoglycan DD-metalloendopeptidase family protein [Aminicella lysinilytica]
MAENEKRSIADKFIDAGAAVIDFHDRTQQKADLKCLQAYYGVALFLHNRRDFLHVHKAKLLESFAIIVLVAIAVLAVYNYATGYEYSYHGRALGYVKDQEDVIRVLDITSAELSKSHDAKIKIEPGSDITFKRVVTLNVSIDDDDTVLKRLTYLSNMRADAYCIYIDGKNVAALSSKAEAKDVIDDVEKYYQTTRKGWDTTYQKVSITEKLRYAPKSVSLTDVSTRESAVNQLIKSKAVTVKTIEKSKFAEVVKYKTVVKKTKSMYKGDSKVVQKGENGKRVATAIIVKENGKQVTRTNIELKVLKPMVKKVVYKGSKTRPKTAPTGTFIMPVSGYSLSSTFGYRWGRMHEGVDLACGTGTPIHAADGGTVVRAGWYSGYGKCVDISHGNGYMTRYGHCSKINVHTGQKVYQGQTIALVGNTGNSYGSHCHFEVRVNGSARNPMKYVNRKYR